MTDHVLTCALIVLILSFVGIIIFEFYKYLENDIVNDVVKEAKTQHQLWELNEELLKARMEIASLKFKAEVLGQRNEKE